MLEVSVTKVVFGPLNQNYLMTTVKNPLPAAENLRGAALKAHAIYVRLREVLCDDT